MSKKFSLQKLLGLYCSNNHWQKKVSKLFQPLSHLINKCSQTKSTQERATRVRACNYVIIETGQNLEDCEGWWLSGCRGSAAEHWRLKPEILVGLVPSGFGFDSWQLLAFFSLSSLSASLHPNSFIYALIRPTLWFLHAIKQSKT